MYDTQLSSAKTAPLDPRIVPQPPHLHWAVVLVLSALTRSLFGEIWLVVQANWIRRVTGRTEPMTWAIVHLCTLPFILFSALLLGVIIGMTGTGHVPKGVLFTFGVAAGAIILALYITAVYKVRAALEAEPIGISLGGVMTFFFGPVYFQYFLHDYVLPDAVELYGPLPAAPAYVPPVPPL